MTTKKLSIITIVFVILIPTVISAQQRKYNDTYFGDYLNHVAFPLGGIGAGMVCLEGTGSITNVSVRNAPAIFNEPITFAAICIKGKTNTAKVLEGPVRPWKIFTPRTTGGPFAQAGNGLSGKTYGLPRFEKASFKARFPFATVDLTDSQIPLKVQIVGWSSFIPTDANNSSLPVAALEYQFANPTDTTIEAVFSFNSKNFISTEKRGGQILKFKNGFILSQPPKKDSPHDQGDFAVFVDDDKTVVDYCWFRGRWFDQLTITWKNITEAKLIDNQPVEQSEPGASLFVPFSLKPGCKKTIKLMFAWYVPKSDLRHGKDPKDNRTCKTSEQSCYSQEYYCPWYAGRFKDIKDIAKYWQDNYNDLRRKSALFRDSFYDTTLPPEVIEAVAANLTILKSPTVLRQTDGRLWAFEGCHENAGCCPGSCTHVWNYAQAIAHLFPSLERTFRRTEFSESQDDTGHQTFRSALPIRPVRDDFYAAADGQLGGIMKIYRDWRIGGNTLWLKAIWPKVKLSLDYCIKTWDPKLKGFLEEPHHNTYDIEFWGANGHSTGFYLGALTAGIEMGKALDVNVSHYQELLKKGRRYMQTKLFDGEYFYQRIQWQGLQASDPVIASKEKWNTEYSPEALKLLEKEGPKYQYGTGCLSDGVLGAWMARVSGLGDILDSEKIKSHLASVYKYNFKKDLSDHANPQRPGYAMGKEGGLLLCTWPKGGKPSLPFVYSNEVWTGIEYQVASHLMMNGMVDKGLEIVRTCRSRYDGRVRNPFDEYECGHWYARAMASYALLQGLTGVRYDAVDKTLYIDSRIGDNFKTFLSTAAGFGNVWLKNGKPFVDIKFGSLDIKRVYVSGKQMPLQKNPR